MIHPTANGSAFTALASRLDARLKRIEARLCALESVVNCSNSRPRAVVRDVRNRRKVKKAIAL